MYVWMHVCIYLSIYPKRYENNMVQHISDPKEPIRENYIRATCNKCHVSKKTSAHTNTCKCVCTHFYFILTFYQAIFISVLQSTVAPVEGRLRRSVPSLPAIKPDRLKTAKTLVEKAVKVIRSASHLPCFPTVLICVVTHLTLAISLPLI